MANLDNQETITCLNCNNINDSYDNFCEMCGSRIHLITKITSRNMLRSINPDLQNPDLYRFTNHSYLKHSIVIMLIHAFLYGLFNFIFELKKEFIIESNVDPEYANSFYSSSATLKEATYAFFFGIVNIVIAWFIVTEILNFIIQKNLNNRGIKINELKKRIRTFIGFMNLPFLLLNIILITFIQFEDNQVYLVYIDPNTILGSSPDSKLVAPLSQFFITLRVILTSIAGFYVVLQFRKGSKGLNYEGESLTIIIFILFIFISIPILTVM